MQKRLDQVGRRLLWTCFSIVILVFIFGLFRQIQLFQLFMSSISGFTLQILIHHTPILREIFGIGKVSWEECVSWVLLGMVPLMILEVQKMLRKVPDAVF